MVLSHMAVSCSEVLLLPQSSDRLTGLADVKKLKQCRHCQPARSSALAWRALQLVKRPDARLLQFVSALPGRHYMLSSLYPEPAVLVFRSHFPALAASWTC